MVARKRTGKSVFIFIMIGLAVVAAFFVWAATASSQGGGGNRIEGIDAGSLTAATIITETAQMTPSVGTALETATATATP